jgi:hypothetical protein
LYRVRHFALDCVMQSRRLRRSQYGRQGGEECDAALIGGVIHRLVSDIDYAVLLFRHRLIEIQQHVRNDGPRGGIGGIEAVQ